MINEFKDKIILVTGGTGSIGSEIIRQLLPMRPKQIRVYSRNDSKQYHFLEQLGHHENIRMLIGDIRDAKRLNLAFENVDIVFHTAALKHVPLCEYNPLEAIKTNVFGSQNIIDAAFKNNVKKVVAISTDKAANPGNTMGLSKLMMEKLFINTTLFSKDKTKFSCVRFGNVAWSDASVLQLWRKQAEKNKIINITNTKATRFFMSLNQAAQLVLRTACLTQGGEIFILKMPSIKLGDLAKFYIKKHYPHQKIKIKTIGNRIGDKIHEDLFDFNDSQKLILVSKEMFIILLKESSRQKTDIYSIQPANLTSYPGFQKMIKLTNYSSKNNINKKAIEKLI